MEKIKFFLPFILLAGLLFGGCAQAPAEPAQAVAASPAPEAQSEPSPPASEAVSSEQPEPSVPKERRDEVSFPDGRVLTLNTYGHSKEGDEDRIYWERIVVSEQGTELQTIPHDGEPENEYDRWLTITDFNFDGCPDLQIFGGYGPRRCWYYAFLWNPAETRYEECEELEEMSNPEVRDGYIATSDSSMEDYFNRFYKWAEGKPLLVEERERNYAAFSLQYMRSVYSVHRLVNGAWLETEIRKMPPKDSPSPQSPAAGNLKRRAAVRFISPAFTQPEARRLAELTGIYSTLPCFDTIAELEGPDVENLLFDVAENYNYTLVQAGGGITRPEREGLAARCFYHSGNSYEAPRFVRYTDMDRVGRYLFGAAFARDKGSAFGSCGDAEIALCTMAGNTGREQERVLSVTKENGKTVVEALSVIIINREIYCNSAFREGQQVGYLSDDGGLFFYSEVDMNKLTLRCYTFEQAADGRYVLASIRAKNTRAEAPGDISTGIF